MGRRRTGSVVQRDGRWLASVPVEPGSKKRKHARFTTEAEARAWVDSQLVELERAETTGVRAAAKRGRASGDRATRIRFTDACDGWFERTYLKRRTAAPRRADSVRSALDRYLIAFFGARITYIDELTVDDVEDFVEWMAGRHLTVAGQNAGSMPMPGQEATLREAARLTGVAKSTIWRAHRAGKFPSERWDTSGRLPRVLIPVVDLVSAGFTIGAPGHARPTGGLRRSTARQHLQLLTAVVRWAMARGFIAVDPTAGVTAIDPDPAVALTPPDTAPARVIYFDECARVAAHLTIHHQTCLWLGRICGLRLGEVFGIHVEDVDAAGFLRVRVQGGAAMERWGPDGRRVKVYEADLKTKAGVRLVPIPPALLEFLMLYIRAWHADPVTGTINGTARLIRPPKPGRGTGTSAYTRALANALVDEHLDSASIGFTNLTHHLRKSFGGDLTHYGQARGFAVSRLLGHKLAPDGGSQITVEHYAPPNPDDLEPFVVAMDTIERLIANSLPGGLLCGSDPYEVAGPEIGMPEQLVHARAVIAEAVRTQATGSVCSIEEAAVLLEMSSARVRRLVDGGVLEGATIIGPTGRPRRGVVRQSVDAYAAEQRDACTLKEAAELTGINYPTLWARTRAGTLESHLASDGRTIMVQWSTVKSLVDEVEARAALDERSLSVLSAAKAIRRHSSTVERLIAVGQLEKDESAGWTGVTYVTRRSLARYQEYRGKDPATVWTTQTRSVHRPHLGTNA